MCFHGKLPVNRDGFSFQLFKFELMTLAWLDASNVNWLTSWVLRGVLGRSQNYRDHFIICLGGQTMHFSQAPVRKQNLSARTASLGITIRGPSSIVLSAERNVHGSSYLEWDGDASVYDMFIRQLIIVNICKPWNSECRFRTHFGAEYLRTLRDAANPIS